MIAAAMGWIGTAGSLSAYILLTQGRWHPTSLRYSALNFTAAGLAASASAVYGAWPSVGSNLLWSCIALHSAVTTLRSRRSDAHASMQQLPIVDHDPEPPTGPQPVLLNAA